MQGKCTMKIKTAVTFYCDGSHNINKIIKLFHTKKYNYYYFENIRKQHKKVKTKKS